MKPQPMSDAEIDSIIYASRQADEGPSALARRFAAARDAQWAAMIGEPVAVADMDLHADHMGPVEAFAFIPENTPLYAIKETP